MTRQLIATLILTAASAFVSSSAQAGCDGEGCHTRSGFNTFALDGFQARFGCSPQQAWLFFQQNPQQMVRFPEAVKILEAQFGAIQSATPAVVGTPAVGGTPAVVGTPAVGGTPAVVGTPAVGGTPAVVGAPAVVDTPAIAGPPAVVDTPAVSGGAVLNATPALNGPAVSAPGDDAIPSNVPPVDLPAAPNGAALADPSAPPSDLPTSVPLDPPADAPVETTATAAPAQSELEPLLGLWINENDSLDQAIAKINLIDVTTAKVTVNTDLGQTEVTKSFAVEEGTVKLGGEAVGTVVSADANKVVLNSNGSEIILIRP